LKTPGTRLSLPNHAHPYYGGAGIFKEKAAEALKLTADDMLANKLIDGIIKEPLGGAHVDPKEAFQNVKDEILKQLEKLKKTEATKLVQKRINKFCAMGVFEEK
jgi:acetyl-CoA carboxylase carboxyl transferase subunit alpha